MRYADVLAQVQHEALETIESRLRQAQISSQSGDPFFDGRAMVLAKVLGRTENEYVPADAVWCAPFGSEWLGPVSSAWSTNGLASHTSREAAIEHAVLEVIERDALARSLPHGWVPGTIAKRRLDAGSPLVSEVESHGFEVYAFDLSVDSEVSVAGVLLFDLETSVVPLTAGYAARRTGAAAVEAALLEAAQSRLTEIHGARDDVSIGERTDGAALRAKLKKQKPAKKVASMPKSGSRPTYELTSATLLAVDLLSWPLHVVKVIAPELLCSELV